MGKRTVKTIFVEPSRELRKGRQLFTKSSHSVIYIQVRQPNLNKEIERARQLLWKLSDEAQKDGCARSFWDANNCIARFRRLRRVFASQDSTKRREYRGVIRRLRNFVTRHEKRNLALVAGASAWKLWVHCQVGVVCPFAEKLGHGELPISVPAAEAFVAAGVPVESLLKVFRRARPFEIPAKQSLIARYPELEPLRDRYIALGDNESWTELVQLVGRPIMVGIYGSGDEEFTVELLFCVNLDGTFFVYEYEGEGLFGRRLVGGKVSSLAERVAGQAEHERKRALEKAARDKGLKSA